MQSQFGGVSMRKLRERERLPSSFRKYISILIGLKWTENDRHCFAPSTYASELKSIEFNVCFLNSHCIPNSDQNI